MRDLDSGVSALLQAVSAPSEEVVWVSGHEGAVLRSADGGESWERFDTPTLDSLQYRDVHGFDADRAVLLSAGPGAQSRIYRTTDGGSSWTLAWLNPEPEGFYDCLDFWDDSRGLAYGDAVDGGLRILRTEDGGQTWRRIEPDRLPEPAGTEGGFAASGTCVETGPRGRAWIATGAGDRPRILRTDDYGDTWSAHDLPLVTGSAAGAFTVVFADGAIGYVLGGDLGQAEALSDNAARSDDGGQTWGPIARAPLVGAVYGSTIGSSQGRQVVIAAGPAGLVTSVDRGESWSEVDERSFWAVGGYGRSAWAVGPDGRIVALVLP